MAGRLRELRARFGYSQQGMAGLADISQGTWSYWERETPQQFAALRTLVEKIEVSADYILGITDDPTPASRRDEWTQEAIETVSLLNELPPARRVAAVAVLKSAIELTEIPGNPELAPAPTEGSLSEELDTRQAAVMALLERMLSPADYKYVLDSVLAGVPLTDTEIDRLIQSSRHKTLGKDLDLLNNDNSRSNV